jgi:hypothetical protein
VLLLNYTGISFAQRARSQQAEYTQAIESNPENGAWNRLVQAGAHGLPDRAPVPEINNLF